MGASIDRLGRVLTGKRLLLVLGSYRSKRHVFEHARDLGVRLVVVDGPGHWMATEAAADGLIERHISVDLWPFETFAQRAVMAIHETGLKFDGIGTIDEFAGGFGARIARDLDLPFHTIEAADTARDKHRAREACARAGLAGPRCARIEGEADLGRAAATVGFPAVLKPISGVGSVQTFRVENAPELRRRYLEIVAAVRPETAHRAGDLSSDRDWFDLMWSGSPHLTLESWIEGRKFDVDLLIENGRLAYAHATDDLEPCGLRDVRRIAPSGLSNEDERALIEHALGCVKAIGFTDGAFNVEVKRTIDGPRMIEVNGRLGGYSTTDIHRAVWGVDLVEQWLRACFRLRMNAESKKPTCFVAESLLPAPHTGTVSQDGFLETLRASADVVGARQWAFEGDVVAGIETKAPDWLGAVLTRGDTREQALATLDRVVASLTLPVTSD